MCELQVCVCVSLARVWVLVETVGACGGGPYWPAKSQASASHRGHHTLLD